MPRHVSLETIRDQTVQREFLYYDERDPCYSWLFPLRLGPLAPEDIWQPSPVPRPADNLTLYVHVPYCTFICKMCPFTHEPLQKKDLTSYVEALRQEIRFYARHPAAKSRPVTTLYFGGGTASSLTPPQMKQILGDIREGFELAKYCEITLECHPRTVDAEYLAQMREHGVNRVSFGIQSFNQRNIDSIKLHQLVPQSRDIVESAVKTGFRSVGIDIMFRYPGQDVSELRDELETAFGLGVHCLSLYALDTDLREMTTAKQQQPPVMIEQEMFYYFHDRLQQEGWTHVAQPDYSRPGHENRQLYDLWGAPQAENIGFGAGAFSEMFNGVTWANLHDSNAYIEAVNRGQVPILMGQRHSWDDTVARYAALGVRCMRVPFAPFRERFGVGFRDLFRFECEELERRGFVQLTDDELRVTRKGKFYIDNISKTFYNLANRGKPQLWGQDLRKLRPAVVGTQAAALQRMEMATWT